jgi:CRISPR-associated exonuclease Cas4
VSAMLVLAVLAGCMALEWLRMRRARGRQERASRPAELRDATLVYMEHAFRTDRPFRLIARLDRAYRIANGDLVLVELKTRWHAQPRATDIIQLSAQRLAIEMATGQRVAPYAFVTVENPDRPTLRLHLRVQLLDRVDIEALAHRRHAILAGQVSADFASSLQGCARCAFRSVCQRES